MLSIIKNAVYWRGPTSVLWNTFPRFGYADSPGRLHSVMTTRKSSTSMKVNYPTSDPKLLAKFKCHPTIPCDIPLRNSDLDALWHHVPDELLPINWSCNWLNFRSYWCLPSDLDYTYSMGSLDIDFKELYGIQYPIRGVMYCTTEWVGPGGLFEEESFGGYTECFVFQDAKGEYYFYYQFSQGGKEYLAKFRAPPGTTIPDFLKHHFRGAVRSVDMDLVLPKTDYSYTLYEEQRELARLHKQAVAQSRCACLSCGRKSDAKLKNLKLVE